MKPSMEKYYDDGTEPTILPHYRWCTGPCDQGRKQCPTPDACELRDSSDDGLEAVGLVVAIIALLTVMGLVVAALWKAR